ncbi:MAG: PQQ-dependent sugar dehydrogenase, partial [Anaerolineales bacterium]
MKGLLLFAPITLLACTVASLPGATQPQVTIVIEAPPTSPTEIPAGATPTDTPPEPGATFTKAPQPTRLPPSPTPTPAVTPANTTPVPPAAVSSLPDGSEYELVAIPGSYQRPVYVTHAGDGSERLFVVEQAGVIWIISGGARLPEPFLDLRANVTRAANEQGLLGLAFHPNYAENGVFFVHYSDRNGNTMVSRLQVSSDPNLADPTSEEVVLTQFQPFPNHNGGQLAFGPDGYLYIGLGDGGSAGDPLGGGQDLTAWLGSILRIDVDGGRPYVIPPDNPFVETAADPEIWAYGLRNPWRFSFDRLTGDLYVGDVGQNDWEEIDYLPAGTGGLKLGWNRMEGNHCFVAGCDPAQFTPPVAEYHQTEGGCSVTGGYVYRGQFQNGLNGVYLYGDFCSGFIWGLLHTPDGGWENGLLMRSGLNISSFGEDETGE